MRENLTSLYAYNKGTDQPVHAQSLMSAFVYRFLQSMISITCFIHNYKNVGSLREYKTLFMLNSTEHEIFMLNTTEHDIFLLINVKLPTSVGIVTFISRMNTN